MFKDIIVKIIAKQVGLKFEDVEKLLETPPSLELGDYSFPCFVLSKKLKKNPNQIAEELANKIKTSKEVEKIENKRSSNLSDFLITKANIAICLLTSFT